MQLRHTAHSTASKFSQWRQANWICVDWDKNHTQRGAHVASVLEVHSLQLLGLVGCFICVSGSWFCQIICTRFPNTFDTVPATAASPLRPPGKSSFIHMLPVRSTEPATNRVTELKNIYGILHFALKSNFIFYTSSKIRHKTCLHTQFQPCSPCSSPPGSGRSREFSLARRTYSPVPANWKAGAVNSALHFICIWRRRWASVQFSQIPQSGRTL